MIRGHFHQYPEEILPLQIIPPSGTYQLGVFEAFPELLEPITLLWKCGYCGRLNYESEIVCLGCGAPLME